MGHSAALISLGAWGMLELGMAGTLTLAFWLGWLLYAAFAILMHTGSTVGAWMACAPPALWAVSSGSDIAPRILTSFTGGDISAQTLVGALLVTVPCVSAVIIDLWYAAVTCKRFVDGA
jgi:hypothetical protein